MAGVIVLALGFHIMKRASLEDVNHAAVSEELKVSRKTPRRRGKGEIQYDEAFEVWGMLFSCLYERSTAAPLYEKITVTIFGRRGTFTAWFQNEEMTSWGNGIFLSDASDSLFYRHQKWLFLNILATVKNAVSIAI